MIQVNEAVTLLLPFHCRTVRLSHRLLESLGGVSRFLLSALGAGLALEQVAEVTGLPGTTLDRQLSFLSQHGFVDTPAGGQVPALSERGHRMLAVEQLLHHNRHPVWLDAFTLKQQVAILLAGIGPKALLPEPPAVGSSLTAVMPPRARAYRHFDESNRLRTLLDGQTLAGLLAILWPGKDALIHEELDNWDYELLRTPELEPQYLSLALPAHSLTLYSGVSGHDPAWPLASLPALDLETRFSREPALPWPVEVPEAERRLVELLSHSVLGPNWRADEPPADARVLALPTSAHRTAPDLPPMALPYGVAAVVKARPYRLACRLDAEAIVTELLQALPGQVFCSARREREEVAA